jgi:hypothetical protein
MRGQEDSTPSTPASWGHDFTKLGRQGSQDKYPPPAGVQGVELP